MKQYLKACANVTCSEIVHLIVMSHVHVRVLRVMKPLIMQNPAMTEYEAIYIGLDSAEPSDDRI